MSRSLKIYHNEFDAEIGVSSWCGILHTSSWSKLLNEIAAAAVHYSANYPCRWQHPPRGTSNSRLIYRGDKGSQSVCLSVCLSLYAFLCLRLLTYLHNTFICQLACLAVLCFGETNSFHLSVTFCCVLRHLQELAAATGKPRFTRRSFSLRQHGRASLAGAIRCRQASLELSPSPARSALLPEQQTPPQAPSVPRKSNWEVIEYFSSSSSSLTRGSKPAQSANLIAVSSQLRHQVELLPTGEWRINIHRILQFILFPWRF